jgi:hypothetical protein
VIADLVRRQGLGPEGAEYAFTERCLNGLRYSFEAAGPIWEDFDMFWDATPLGSTPDSEGKLVPFIPREITPARELEPGPTA